MGPFAFAVTVAAAFAAAVCVCSEYCYCYRCSSICHDSHSFKRHGLFGCVGSCVLNLSAAAATTATTTTIA